MRKYGGFEEQDKSDFRTSGDNSVVTIQPPATIVPASLTLTLPDAAANDTLLSITSTATLTNKELTDTNCLFVDGADTTKKLAFELSGITTATTRTLTIPNISDTLVTKTSTDTFTNKTFDADGTGNSITNIENADIKSGAAIEFSKMENLTNSRALVSDGSGDVSVSTVTSAEIGQLSGVSSTVVGETDTQTLTNKTVTALEVTGGSFVVYNQEAETRWEEGGGGSNYLGFKAPTNVTANQIWTLPDGDGTAGTSHCAAKNGAS